MRYWWLRSPFEAEHGIDHMLEHARPGDRSVLGDMTDQHHRGAAFLGEPDQFLRRGAYLADGARRAFDQVRMHRLDRIDHQQGGRTALAERRQDIASRGGGRELHRRRAQPEPPRAQPHLIGRLLARDIGDGQAGQRHLRRSLKQQGRLADAGIAPDQCRRSLDEAAAERAVEFGDAARHAFGQRDLRVEPDHRHGAAARLQIMPGLEWRDDPADLFDQRVPFGAIGALPRPSVRDRPAGLADISLLKFSHRKAA